MENLLEQINLGEWLIPILAISVLIFTIIFASIVAYLFNRAIKKAEKENDEDLTNLKFLKRIIAVLIYITGIAIAIYMIPQLRVIATTLFAGAGVLALAVGFASQQALSNIIGGIFIVIFKPYRINDRIDIRADLMGLVEDINLRHTVIRDFQNRRIIVPNSVISNEILINSNYEDSSMTKWIDIGISYNSDIDLAKSIMAEEVEKHPLFIDARNQDQIDNGDPVVPVRVVSLGDSSVNLRAWATTNNPGEAFILGCDLIETLKKRFDAEGIEIPFPHRTVYQRSED